MVNSTKSYPYSSAQNLTANDSTIVPDIANKAFMVTTAGTVSLIMWNGVTISFTVVANTIYNIHFKVFRTTGTSASGIIGFGWV